MLLRDIPIIAIIPITKIQMRIVCYRVDMKFHMRYIFDQISLDIVTDQRWSHTLCNILWFITVQTHSNMESICNIW